MMGMVCTLAVERKSGNRYSFQFRMSVRSVVAARPGPGERQHDVPEDPEPRGAVELRALLEFDRQAGEEIVHQPDHDGQVGHRVGQDQRQVGIKQPTAWNIM